MPAPYDNVRGAGIGDTVRLMTPCCGVAPQAIGADSSAKPWVCQRR